nr:MarR family transcriptional regulator [Maliibacterium massiliense]
MFHLDEKNTQKFATLMQLLDRRILRPFYTRQRYDLSPLQINVLLLLDKDVSLSMSQIAYQLDISKPNVTPIVDRLIDGDYVVRIPSKVDRRVIEIRATEKGQKFIRSIRSDMRKMLEGRFANVNEEKFSQFIQSMDVCIDFISGLDE